MTYHVILKDGRRFGPATEEHLRQWLQEGRIGSATLIEDEQGVRKTLAEVPGFEGAASAPPTQFASPPEAPVPVAKRPAWIIPVVIAVVGCVCAISLVPAILFPVFSQARLSAKMKATVSNAKRMGLAVVMYAADNDDRLPPNLASAREAMPCISPYTETESIFRTLNPAGGEFLGNRKIEKANTTKADYPDIIAVFYESKTWPGGQRVVTWLDGHATAAKSFDPVLDLKDIKGR